MINLLLNFDRYMKINLINLYSIYYYDPIKFDHIVLLEIYWTRAYNISEPCLHAYMSSQGCICVNIVPVSSCGGGHEWEESWIYCAAGECAKNINHAE